MNQHKQYPWKFKLSKWQVEWWQSDVTLGTDHYFYYIRVDRIDQGARDAWKKIDMQNKGWVKTIFGYNVLLGYHKFWHDTIHAVLNLQWFSISWSTPWTTVPKDFWK